MILLTKIKPFYFFVSLFIGFLFTYLFTPMPDVIYQYPNPSNEDKLVYIDKTKSCFKYKSEEVECPKNKNKIFEYPVHPTKEKFLNNKLKQ